MDILEDPALRNEILKVLQQEYSLLEPRTGIHSSDLIYCLTKSYHNKMGYIPPTEAECLMFSIGLGLERVIVQFQASRVSSILVCDCEHTPESHSEGILQACYICQLEGSSCIGVWLSPDFLLQGIHSELKTTRWGENHELPSTWLQQVLNYCYATDQPFYNLVVLHLVAAKLRGWRIFPTQEEVEENWGNMLVRKDILIQHLNQGKAPKPFTYNESWECQYCRYRLRCDLAVQMEQV